MRTLRSPLFLAAAFALGAFLTGCQKSPPTIKIGLAAVQSGSDAQIGLNMLQGSQIAIDEWNARGGVLGQKIESISLDDEANPQKAITVANTLVHSGVVAVLGHFNSGCTIPASRVYNDARVIQISPGSTNPLYTEQGFPYAFRICGRDDQQGPIAARYMHDVLKLNKIAILHNKTTAGQGQAAEVKAAFEAMGGTVVMFQGISANDFDFGLSISAIKGSGADGFFWGGMYGQGARLCLALHQAGLNIPFVACDGCFDPSFINTVGANASNVFISYGKDYRKFPAAQPFLDKYKTAYGRDAGAYSVYGYDAANVLFTAMDKAQSTDADKVAAVLKSQTFQTILGDIDFNAKGDIKKPGFVIWTIKDGKFQVAADSP
ncbi:MAG: branched-chain amino acid ABC transporter substrate-binding protein [Verrucomicrobiota bacterium]